MERENKAYSGVKIEYHADDYGMFPTQSQRILDCFSNGCLNGVSVMPNSDWLCQCMEMLRPVQEDIAVTVHLNLMEGKSLAFPEGGSALTDQQGVLRASFWGLLVRSCLPGREKLRRQLKEEFRRQIFAVKQYLNPNQPIRLDGHAHYHMIPVAFDAMMDVIREEKLEISYIRIPRENIGLYLRNWKHIKDYAPINLAKVAILNLLAARNQWKYKEILSGYEQKIFMGVFLSGRMHGDNVRSLLPDACALAKRRNCGLEMLAHPGGVYEPEDIARLTNRDDILFLTSSMRRKETTMFQIVKEGNAQ